MAADPTSPVIGDSDDDRALVPAEYSKGRGALSPLMTLATVDDEDVARPAGTEERPLWTRDAGTGAPSDAEATSNGSIIGILKRIRTLLGGALSVTPTITGRSFVALTDGAGVRQAVALNTARFNLPALNTNRGVRISTTTRCFIRFGNSSVNAVVNGTSIPIEANAPEYLQVPAGATHFAVIRDLADGFISMHPVAD
jgi:hypothetical protein